MPYDPDRHHRRSIRLRGHDYATPGTFFITICTQGREPILQESSYRMAVREAWAWLPQRFDNVELDEFVIMPDHVHFIVSLLEDERRGGHPAAQNHPASQGGQTPAPTLAHVVGTFKTVAAKAINRARDSVGQQVWQRNYYERIVRNEAELARIRAYIRNNPAIVHTHDDREDLTNAWL